MAIAIVGTGTEAEVVAGTAVEVTAPSANNGECMVMFAGYSDDVLTPRLNESGWTTIGSLIGTSDSDRYIAVWGKIASSESGTYTVDTVESVSVTIHARIVTFSGVHADILDQTTVNGPDTGNSATYDPAAITTQTANAWVITAICAAGGTNASFTEPSGYTSLFAHTSTDIPYLDAAYLAVASPGATDPGTWNVTTAVRDTCGLTLALKATVAPGWTATPSMTSQTATAYTVGFTPSVSATVYGVAVIAGSAAPSVAQVKAGQNGAGGSAKASNSKAVTGADTLVLTPSDSPAFPRYDLYFVLNNGGGDSSLQSLAGEYLDAPTGKLFATLTSLDTTSPFYGTGTAISDTVVLDTTTDPDAYAVSCAVDGTVSYAAGGDDSRQIVDADVYDYSAGAYLGAGTLVFNNLAPDPSGAAFSEPLGYQKDVTITAVNLLVYAPDPESDTVVATALDALPAGLSITTSSLSGTPTAYGSTDTQIQWADQYGATYVETVTIQVGDVVPDVIHIAEGLARGQIQAVASFTTTTTYTADAYVAIGDVISTDPVAGTLAPYDQVVSMLVSNGSQAVGTGGSGYPVGWQGKRKKLTLKQQPNKHLKKMLDDVGKKVLATHGKPKKSTKVKAIKLWQ